MTTLALVPIAVVLTAGAYFLVNVSLPPGSAYVSALNLSLITLPTFWATRRWLGWKDAITIFVVLGVLGFIVETTGLATGFPYGNFSYSEHLGPRVFGITPWTLFFAWTPLILGAFSITMRLFLRSVALRIILTPLLLVAIDSVIDPGAVRVGFWSFETGGDYYGVPLSNFGGWLLSGVIGTLVIELFLKYRKPLLPAPVQMIGTLWLTIFMWTAVAAFSCLVYPLASGVVLLAGLTVYYLRYFYAFDEMLVMVNDIGQPIGTLPKAEVHHGNTELHSAFSVFLFNEKGEVLLQQRALAKKSWPGIWSNSCCGHVMLHETIEDAARRRLRHELGLKARDIQVLLPDFRYHAEMNGVVENEICAVLVARCDSEPRINREEVAAVRWISWDEWVREVAEPGNGYSYWSGKETEQLIRSAKFSAFRTANGFAN